MRTQLSVAIDSNLVRVLDRLALKESCDHDELVEEALNLLMGLPNRRDKDYLFWLFRRSLSLLELSVL